MLRPPRLSLFVAAFCLALLSADLSAVVNVYSVNLSNTNPSPGSVVTVSIQYCAGQWEEAHWLVAARPVPATGIASCPTTNQTFLVYNLSNNGTPSTTSPASGWPGGYSEPTTTCPVQTKTFSVTIPSSLAPGTTYNMIAAAGPYWADCGSFSGQAYAPFTLAAPSASNSTLLKRVEGTAQNGQLMLYWLDYDIFNSSGISVRDLLPACATLVDAAPEPIDGSAYDSPAAGTVQWDLPNADAASPDPYHRQGSLWVLVSLVGCGAQVCNTGEVFSSATGGGWTPSNTVCQTVGQANVQLLKSQLDSGGNPVSAVPNGTQVQYVLQYQFSGSGLKCFDGFQGYPLNQVYQSTGGLAATNPNGGAWYIPAGDPGTVGWKIISGGAPGEKIIQYNCTGACQGNQYRVLLYDCPTAKPNGEDFCGGMVEADVRIDGNVVNGDTGLVIRADQSGNGYLAVLTVDPYPGAAQPGSVGGHFQIQKNTAGSPCWNGQCGNPNNAACPAAMGKVMAPALAPQFGIWYTIKVLEQPLGTFYAKYWERGTAEPTGWYLTWTDNTNCNGPLIPCAVDGNAWRPGIAGQADLMSYDNFRLYAASSLSGARLWDSVPAGIDYVSASPAANGQVPSNSNAPGDLIRWDFTGSNFGAVGGVLYEGTGSFTWVGQADCSESITAVNRASLGASVPALLNDSNQTVLSIIGCNTPTNTPTRTPTPTQSPSSTVTPSATPTHTPSATPSASPSPSATPSITLTRTPTATPSATPSSTPSSTATPTVTITTPYSPTVTPTQTLSFTPSDTPSQTATPSATLTATESATATLTATPTLTSTATLTATESATATPTRTATLTSSPSPTSTATRSATPSATITWTFTPSPSITPTPVPLPHRLRLSVYNSAGERVKLLFDGAAQIQPGGLDLSSDGVAAGAGALSIGLKGYLMDPRYGLVSSLAWAADNDAGQWVAGGVYSIVAEVWDPFGQVSTYQKPVQVLSVSAGDRLAIYNSAGELVAAPELPPVASGRKLSGIKLGGEALVLAFDASGSPLGGGLRFDLQDESGAVTTLLWDGRNGAGAPVAAGSYVAQLVYHPGGPGSVQAIESRSFVVIKSGEAAPLDGLLAAPNPVMHGADLQVRFTSHAGLACEAKLFSLDGAAVQAAAVGPGGSRLALSTRGLAPGIYLLELRRTSGTAVLARRVLKVAVIR